MNSLLSQKYPNNKFKIIIINDASTDESEKFILNKDGSVIDDKIIYIKNKINQTALPNICDAIINYCHPDDIVVLVDGDDQVSGSHVLRKLNDFYNKKSCDLQYGQFRFSTGQMGFASEYTEEEFKNLRKAPFKVSHIRTFRSFLFFELIRQDPNLKAMKDALGGWYTMTYDVALFFPLIEIVGDLSKIGFNNEVLYEYNFQNPHSDHIKSQETQTRFHQEIANKPPFKKIESYL